MNFDAEKFLPETKQADIKQSVEWLFAQDMKTKVHFTQQLRSLLDTNLVEIDKTKDEVWITNRKNSCDFLIKQLRGDKSLGLADESIDETKLAETFYKITEKNDEKALRSILLELVIETYQQNFLNVGKSYSPPSTKQIAEELIYQGDEAIGSFFWPENKCFHYFTVEERNEIKSFIDTAKK